MITLFTRDRTTAPNAMPMITATARSMTLPRSRNFLRSWSTAPSSVRCPHVGRRPTQQVRLSVGPALELALLRLVLLVAELALVVAGVQARDQDHPIPLSLRRR